MTKEKTQFKKIKKDILLENKFLKRVTKDTISIIKKCKNKIEKKDLEIKREELSNKERFYSDVFRSMMEIVSQAERMNYCLVFLNSYPNIKLWRKIFTRSDYISYHLENYCNNVVGIFDRCLLLVNDVYDLGFRPQDVKYELIISNKHIKRESCKYILRFLDKGMQNTRQTRNYVIHRGTLSDKKLIEIKMYEYVIEDESLKDKEDVLKFLNKFEIKTFLDKKKKEIKKSNEIILTIIDKFLDSLSDKYQERIDSFK